MGIWKIDGIREDYRGRKNEEEFNVNLLVRKGQWRGVQISIEITPLYCLNCKRQLDGFYKHDGSRYGHVGEVACNNCGSIINCIDNDNIVTELKTYSKDGEELIIDYYKLYNLEQKVWKSIKDKTRFDIFQAYKNNEWTTLEDVISKICFECDIELSDKLVNFSVISDKIRILPRCINRWLSLLCYLNIDG